MPRIIEIKEGDKLQTSSYWRGYFINNIPVDYVVNALHREQLYKGGLYDRYPQPIRNYKKYFESGELCLRVYYIGGFDRIIEFYGQTLSESSKNIISISNSSIIQISGIPGRILAHA